MTLYPDITPFLSHKPGSAHDTCMLSAPTGPMLTFSGAPGAETKGCHLHNSSSFLCESVGKVRN